MNSPNSDYENGGSTAVLAVRTPPDKLPDQTMNDRQPVPIPNPVAVIIVVLHSLALFTVAIWLLGFGPGNLARVGAWLVILLGSGSGMTAFTENEFAFPRSGNRFIGMLLLASSTLLLLVVVRIAIDWSHLSAQRAFELPKSEFKTLLLAIWAIWSNGWSSGLIYNYDHDRFDSDRKFRLGAVISAFVLLLLILEVWSGATPLHILKVLGLGAFAILILELCLTPAEVNPWDRVCQRPLELRFRKFLIPPFSLVVIPMVIFNYGVKLGKNGPFLLYILPLIVIAIINVSYSFLVRNDPTYKGAGGGCVLERLPGESGGDYANRVSEYDSEKAERDRQTREYAEEREDEARRDYERRQDEEYRKRLNSSGSSNSSDTGLG